MEQEKKSEFNHYSVMLHETVDALRPERGGVYVDCTLGGGGHSLYLASKLPVGSKLIGIDQDVAAIEAASKRLADFSDCFTAVRSNYSEFDSVLDQMKIDTVDGVMIDLGVSSYQLDTPERGFSYMHDAPLDMRMDSSAPKSAYDIVNGYSVEQLRDIFFQYGEEKFSSKIAYAIAKARTEKPIQTTLELVNIIKDAMPAYAKSENQHPAKRVFQAIRIEVNDELAIISPTIRTIVNRLSPGGRLAVITFHSLEDREVKKSFADLAKACVCPPDFPVCVCKHKAEIRLLTRKPIVPSDEEIAENPRSRSAKLRIAEKI